jgi:long-chain acyl-CoA synthetase
MMLSGQGADEVFGGYKRYEKVVKFTLVDEEWTRENGLLTPTLKLRRNVIDKRYHDLIEKMYT